MKFILPALFSLLLASLGGCASEPVAPFFVEAPAQTLPPPPADQAQIVFLEPINSIQGHFPVGLYEVNGSTRTHLAITGSHSKAVLNFTPGRHMLMAVTGVKAHFLEANVEAGKRYYVLVRFVYGNGFQLRPVRTDGSSDYSILNKDFPNWISGTKQVVMTAEGEEGFKRANIAKFHDEGWQTWMEKSPQQRAELTLNPTDAVAN